MELKQLSAGSRDPEGQETMTFCPSVDEQTALITLDTQVALHPLWSQDQE